MRRKHEFGHGDLVSITEKEKATLLPNFFYVTTEICLFESNNHQKRFKYSYSYLIQYKYIIAV